MRREGGRGERGGTEKDRVALRNSEISQVHTCTVYV